MAVAALRPAIAPSPLWGRRLTEWGVLLALILVVVATAYVQTQRLRGEAELARLRSTLGALRTALVVAHLERVVQAQASAQAGRSAPPALPPVSRNPFLALARLPPNVSYVLPVPGAFRFDGLGQPLTGASTPAPRTINVVNATRTINVEADTGYVHD